MHSSHVPFTRILVSEPKRLAIVNHHFHMPRTKAVFDHVFAVSAKAGEDDAGYDPTCFYVENALPPDVLKAGMEREAESLPKFYVGGELRMATPTLNALHDWVFRENTAYATRRLIEDREKVDSMTLNTY